VILVISSQRILLKFAGGDSEEKNGGIVKGNIITENGGRV